MAASTDLWFVAMVMQSKVCRHVGIGWHQSAMEIKSGRLTRLSKQHKYYYKWAALEDETLTINDSVW